MSDIDLTEAVEVAARAFWDETPPNGTTYDSLPVGMKHNLREAVLPAMLAAAPLIEAAVREKVAAEIEADREAVKRRHGSEPEDVYVRGCLYGSSVAAGIAKNGPRL